MLASPNPKDPWPPIPSVLRENECLHDLCNLQWTLRRSHVALLLSRICAGMDSGASLQDVLARVRDCDALGDLLACAQLDACGQEFGSVEMRNLLLYTVEDYDEEPLLLCWERDDHDLQHMAIRRVQKRFKYALDPLKRRATTLGMPCDAECLSYLAKTAAKESDLLSFRWIVQKAMRRVPDCQIDLWGVMRVVGGMDFSGDDDYAALDHWMTPVYQRANAAFGVFTDTYCAHDRATFERIVKWMIYEVRNESGCVDNVMKVVTEYTYTEWVVPALCKMWHREEYLLRRRGALAPGDDLSAAADLDDDHLNPKMQWRESMRRLMRTTIVTMYDEGLVFATGKWKQIGWLLDAMAHCCHANDPCRAIASFTREDRWVSKFAGEGLCTRGLKLGWVLWRLQLHRERQRCLVEWLDAAGVYAPTGRVDKWTAKAPKRLRDEWEQLM